MVGMSGGIDSSVAAYLLKKEGYEVEGVTMLIWKKNSNLTVDPNANSCYNPREEYELQETKEICRKLGIVHHTVDLKDLYETTVLKNFRSEYMSARTPNPCIWCNTLIKFGAMVESSRALFDFDYFATGHYARIEKGENGRMQLLRAVDTRKDQSYFLSRLSQKQLSSTLFPLGSMTKDEVRKIDVELGLHREDQDESQDFYSGDYTELLGLEDRKGKIILADNGKTLGFHNGFWHYTIGQRKGLGIAYSEPLYVVALDSRRNEVIVGTEKATRQEALLALNANWVGEEDFQEGKEYRAKIRSTSRGDVCTAVKVPGGFELHFPSPVKAATPGQSAVVYDGDRVIASAVIEKAW